MIGLDHGQMPEQPMNTGSDIYALGTESNNRCTVKDANCELVFPDPGRRSRGGGPKPLTPRERLARFLSYIGPAHPVTGCREWQGARLPDGYGQFHAGRVHGKCKVVHAHRTIYELAHGLVADHLHVRHTCDNPPCCNLDHLVVGTPYENVHDTINRGRAAKQRPGRWVIPAEERERAIRACVVGPRGTTARIARELGVSRHHLYAVVARYLAVHGRPEAA